MIFDTHAHYEDGQFDADREALLASLQEHGITRIVNVSSTLESLEKTRRLTEEYDWIRGAYGLHPEELTDALSQCPETELTDRVRACCRLPETAAVGEIGLDYYWEKDPEKRNLQQTWFRRQLRLAREENLPVIIHTRDAAEDTLRIAKEENLGEIGGVMHCWPYSVEMAREYLNMGLFLGIGGVVTFKNARKLKESVAYAPLESLVLETDCPYLAPVPHRGKRNCSLYLPLVVEAIADIKGVTPGEVEAVTFENACRLYRIKE